MIRQGTNRVGKTIGEKGAESGDREGSGARGDKQIRRCNWKRAPDPRKKKEKIKHRTGLSARFQNSKADVSKERSL